MNIDKPDAEKNFTCIMFVLTLAAIGGYILLLNSHRAGYLLILLSASLIFFGLLTFSLTGVLAELFRELPLARDNRYVYQFYYRVSPWATLGTAVGQLVLPAITGLVLLNRWREPPRQYLGKHA